MTSSTVAPSQPVLVDRDDLKVGMFVVGAAGKWITHSLWRGNFVIEDVDTLNKVAECGAKQFLVDPARSRAPAPAAGAAADAPRTAGAAPTAAAPAAPTAPVTPGAPIPRRAAPTGTAAASKTSLDAELRVASKLCDEAKAQVVRMLDDARLGKEVDVQACQEVVEPMVYSVFRDPNALLTLTRLRGKDEYTYMHSVTVCVLMTAFAKELGMPRESLGDLALAGLLHDVGKALVPLDILNKPGKLTDEEFGVIKQHPARGEAFLRQSGVDSEVVRDVCLHHHERVDGTGYPERLTGEQFTQVARMGAICDVYDALTSDRCYKEGWRPDVALKNMSSWQGHFDRQLLAAFIRSVGIYPPTSLVRLASGRIGVVVSNNSGSLRSPVVRVFYDTRRREPLPVSIVDLSAPNVRDEIVGCESKEDWPGLNLEALVLT